MLKSTSQSYVQIDDVNSDTLGCDLDDTQEHMPCYIACCISVKWPNLQHAPFLDLFPFPLSIFPPPPLPPFLTLVLLMGDVAPRTPDFKKAVKDVTPQDIAAPEPPFARTIRRDAQSMIWL